MSKVGHPLSNSWSTSGQPDFVRTLGRRKTVRNRQGKILYTELLKSWPTLGQLLANSPPMGSCRGLPGNSPLATPNDLRSLLCREFASAKALLSQGSLFQEKLSSLEPYCRHPNGHQDVKFSKLKTLVDTLALFRSLCDKRQISRKNKFDKLSGIFPALVFVAF